MEQHEQEYQDIWDLSERLRRQKSVQTEKHWQQLQGRIRKERFQTRFLYYTLRIAAALLLPALVISGYLYKELQDWEQEPVEQIELTAAYGVVSKVVLSDGSEVWLNSGSTLTYPKRFVGEKREVHLSGEAYFKVESDKEHRFEVKTSDGITVSAYGTEFNVAAYQDDADISATLTKGNIHIEQAALQLKQELIPGEQAVFTKESKQLHLEEANLLAATAWKDGKLVFRRTSMEEVAKALSRHFNVDIHLQGKEIYDYSYSATFTTETLSEVLSLLEATAPIRCEIINPTPQGDFAFSKKKVIIRPM